MNKVFEKVVSTKWYFACATILFFLRALFWEFLPSSLTYVALLGGFCMFLIAGIGSVPRDASFFKPIVLWFVFACVIFLSSILCRAFDGRIVCLLFSIAAIVFFSVEEDQSDTIIITLIAMLAIFALSTFFFYIFKDRYKDYIATITTINPSFPTSDLKKYHSGLTSHYSYNGAFNGLGFILSAGMLMRKRRGLAGSLRWAATTALFFFALLLVSKRSMLLFGVVAVVATYLLFGGEKKWRNAILVIITCIVVIAIASALVPGIASTIKRLTRTFEASSLDSATSGRIQLWAYAIDGWLKKPLFGQGWGTFEYHWPSSDSVSVVAHNDFLQVLYSIGLVGLGLLFACLAASWKTIRSVWSIDRKAPDMKKHAVVPVCFCVLIYSVLYGFTVGSLLVSPFVFQPFFMCFGFLHGIVFRPEEGDAGNAQESLCLEDESDGLNEGIDGSPIPSDEGNERHRHEGLLEN